MPARNEPSHATHAAGKSLLYATSREAISLIKDASYAVLDVRPPHEADRCAVIGSVLAPAYINDTDYSPLGLMKQYAAFGMGGWFLGGQHTKESPTFMDEVAAALPKSRPVVVCCQSGLRSLAAAEALVGAGWTEVVRRGPLGHFAALLIHIAHPNRSLTLLTRSHPHLAR